MTAKVSPILSDADLARCRAINMRYRDRVKEIALAVSAETAVPLSAIYGKSRLQDVVQARHLVMYIARREGMSLQAIGTALNRDHSTVQFAVREEEKRRGER